MYRIGYEWKIVIVMYSLIFGSIGTVVFLRYQHVPYLSLLLVKFLLLILFVWIGVSAGILNKVVLRNKKSSGRG